MISALSLLFRPRFVRVAEEEFELRYIGPALETGRMEVRDLAPSLLSLGSLFVEANRVIDPLASEVSLEVRAQERGSFDVALVISQRLEELRELLTSPPAEALVNLIALVVGAGEGGKGLFWLIQWLRGRAIERQEEIRPGEVRITVENETVEFPSKVLDLHGSLIVRRRAKEVIAPVAKSGIDRVEIYREAKTVVSVGKQDLPAFEIAPQPEALLPPQTVELDLLIRSAILEGKRHWEFSDATSNFRAQIEDERFLEAVRNRTEEFRSGDKLRCRVRVEQDYTPDGQLATTRTIEEVLDHIRPPFQQRLSD